MNVNKNNKDLILKLMCKILFKEMGYITHYEIKLRTKSYIQLIKVHDISDIDVYGCNFFSDMTFSTIGAECKSGETNALEELYKFIGVIDYYGLDKRYFVKSKIHQNARQVAIKRRVSCLTEAELRRLLIGLGIDVDKQVKIENAKYYKLKNVLNAYKKNNEKLIDYITYDFWNKENWRRVHSIIHLLKNYYIKEMFPETNIQINLLYYYVLELFSLSVLHNIYEAMLINYSDIDDSLKIALYGGAEALSEKQKIYDLVNQATNQSNSFSPTWESEFISLSSRFTGHTKDSSRVIHLLQEVRENAFYPDRININSSILRKYTDLTRKFTQDIIHFLSKHSGLNIKIFDEFMRL